MREDDLLISLHRTVSKMDRTFAAVCKEHGLTLAQFAVMQALYRYGDQIIGELREAAISSDGTISVVIKNLEKLEMVRRKENPGDRRSAVISLTDGGRRMFQAACPDRNRALEHETAVWTPAEQKRLQELLQKYLDAHR